MTTKYTRAALPLAGRRVIAATIAIVSIALVSTAASEGTAVVAVIHPMQPIGNIDCCH